jgi:serine/threonine-protein kinase
MCANAQVTEASEPRPEAVESQPTVLAEGGTIAHRVKSPVVEDSFVGTELGGTYKVVDVLAEGGMGRLYEAEHVRIGRRYVVKIIHTPLAHRDDLKARFDREARAMAKVRSDHVIDVVDVLSAPDGRTCIITEKLEGQDLDRKLGGEGRLPVGEAVHLVRQACRGLASAHAQGIVHRDLKPSNLFLAKDAGGGTTLKILDFGVAKVGGDAEMTGTGVIVGTPAYMAPEQARSASSTDARADVYALGAVLYRALTGQPPYGGGEASATLVRLLEESPQRPSIVEKSVPPAIEAVIEKAMARDPAERYASAVELDVALAPFDEPSRATLAGTMATTKAADPAALGRKARLARPLAALAAALATIGAAVGVGVTLALVVDGLSSTTTIGTPELVLVGIGSIVALGLAGASAYRALSSAWRSVAMVEAITARFARVLLVGFGALGLLQLASSAYAALQLHQPASNDPLWAAARTLLALGAGGAAALLGRSKR